MAVFCDMENSGSRLGRTAISWFIYFSYAAVAELN